MASQAAPKTEASFFAPAVYTAAMQESRRPKRASCLLQGRSFVSQVLAVLVFGEHSHAERPRRPGPAPPRPLEARGPVPPCSGQAGRGARLVPLVRPRGGGVRFPRPQGGRPSARIYGKSERRRSYFCRRAAPANAAAKIRATETPPAVGVPVALICAATAVAQAEAAKAPLGRPSPKTRTARTAKKPRACVQPPSFPPPEAGAETRYGHVCAQGFLA